VPRVNSFLGFLAGCSPSIALATSPAFAETLEVPQTDDAYWIDGEETLERTLAREINTNEAKNIVFFIGDGMNIPTITAARILEGQQMGLDGEEHMLSFEHFPYVGLAKTYNTDAQVADSAGTASATQAGVKMRKAVIGLRSSVARGDCEASAGNEVTSISMMAATAGKAHGVVTTTRVTHATPAATYAHIAERNWEDDTALADVPGDCKDIALQMLEFPYGEGIDLVLGGGRRHFLPQEVADPEYEGETGRRGDGRDLTEEWLERYGDDAAYVWNLEQFQALDPATVGPVLGLFEPSHMQYEADRERDAAGEPSLTEMTTFAIEKLSQNESGFYLMVEGGRIDHAHHANNAYRSLTDTIEFARAIQAAVDMVDLDETLIVVTADHGHVFTINGYPDRGNPILGLVVEDGEITLGDDGKPYTTLMYTNGPGAVIDGSRLDLSEIDTTDMDFIQPALVPRSSETHAGGDVSVHAIGPWSHLFAGMYEQSYIFHAMNHASNIMEKAVEAQQAMAE
jgi:alkaline phosphatase